MKSKIRIIYFLSGIKSGGVEQFLINYCSRLDKKEYELIVVYQHEPVQVCLNKLESAGCKAIRITARSENFLANIIDSYKIIKELQPDIVHSNMNLMNFCSNLPAKWLKVPVRISHSHIAEKNISLLYRLILSISRKLIKYSSNILFSCGKEASQYLYKTEKDVYMINNAIDIRMFENNNSFYDEYRKSNRVIIGHVGRFTKQKNHKRMINIFYEFMKLEPNSLLLLAGMGELEEEVKQQVKKLNIERNVVFLGAISDMSKFYNTIDLFLLPSLYEGFPVVALEVQAAGVKSLFSDTIDKKIKITNLVNFYSLKNNDKEWANEMERIIGSDVKDDYYKKLTNSGYNVDVEAKKLDELYKKFVNED